ncbi:MAG TPA: hypothetical protein VGI55_17165 [Solirubrobacteraceae bacterium]|jgi:hypothetical protein
MTRSEAKTFLEDASRNEGFFARSGVPEERRSCLVCGARIGSGAPTIQISGALVHLRCAVYRRRLVRR